VFTARPPVVHLDETMMLPDPPTSMEGRVVGMKVEGVFRAAKLTKAVPAGEVIFTEGDQGDEMFGIIEGRVALRNAEGAVAELGPDEVFGEMAIIDASPRMATAVAMTDAVLAVIDHHRFLFLVHETPTFALQVMSTMADRLRSHPLTS
jgi:CRP-like cAMP-binding protein